MEKKIRVVIKEPEKLPTVTYIENSLESFQKIVGGYIEYYRLFESRPLLGIYINEEGKLLGLEPNLYTGGDFIVGTVVAISTDPYGNTRGLDDDETKIILAALSIIGL
jgi:hypothetical protein